MKPELSAIYQVPEELSCTRKKKAAVEERHPYFTQGGEDREDNPNRYIANLRDGAWAEFKYFDIRQSSRIRINVRGNAEGEMLMQDEKGWGKSGQLFRYAHRQTGRRNLENFI